MDRGRPGVQDVLFDIAKILGGVVRDTLDVGDYRITLIIERRVDDKMGVLVDNISVNKRMSVLEADMIIRRLKEMVDKK